MHWACHMGVSSTGMMLNSQTCECLYVCIYCTCMHVVLCERVNIITLGRMLFVIYNHIIII